METLKQPLQVRSAIGETFAVYMQADLLKVLDINQHSLNKLVAQNEHYKKVAVLGHTTKFLVAAGFEQHPLPTQSVLSDINGVFQVQFANGTWHSVQFIKDYAHQHSLSAQGAIKHVRKELTLTKIETQSKRGFAFLVVLD